MQAVQVYSRIHTMIASVLYSGAKTFNYMYSKDKLLKAYAKGLER